MTGKASEVHLYELGLTFGTRIIINTLAHPFEYAKVLIQIGHEPLPPYPTRSLFGRPAYALPNVFKYVKYIKNVDGLSGCYRGLTPKVSALVIGSIVGRKTAECFDVPELSSDPEDEVSDEKKRNHFLECLKRDMLSRTASVVVTHPFHVIALRMMAEFVGGEAKYTGLWASIGVVYREQGVLGFFTGLLPRWLGEMITLLLASTVTFVVNSYLIQDSELKSFTTPTIQYLASSTTYPFSVVTSCMIVNDCGLAAGLPPHMPRHGSWLDCWAFLSRTGQLSRGSSLLWRYHQGPHIRYPDGSHHLLKLPNTN